MPHRTEALVASLWLFVSAFVWMNPNLVQQPHSSYDLLVAEHEHRDVDLRVKPQTSDQDLFVFTTQDVPESIESPSDFFRRLLPLLALLSAMYSPFVISFLVNLFQRRFKRAAHAPHDLIITSSSALGQLTMTLLKGIWQIFKLAVITELREILEPFAIITNVILSIVPRTLSGIHRIIFLLMWFYLHIEFVIFNTLHQALNTLHRAFESAGRLFHNRARSARDRRNLRKEIKSLEMTLSKSESSLDHEKEQHARTFRHYLRELNWAGTALAYEKQKVEDIKAERPIITSTMWDSQNREIRMTRQKNIDLRRERDFERAQVVKRDGFREQNIKLKEDLREKNMDNATVVRERNQAQASLNSERQNREQKELWIREAETKKHESKRLELEAQIKQLKNQLKEDHDELLAEKRKREDDAKRVVSQAASDANTESFIREQSDEWLLTGRTLASQKIARREHRIAKQGSEIVALKEKTEKLRQEVIDEKALRKEAQGDRDMEARYKARVEERRKAKIEEEEKRAEGLKKGEELASKIADLASKNTELASTLAELARKEEVLASTVAELARKDEDLISTRAELARKAEVLSSTVAELARKDEELISTKAALAGKTEELATKEEQTVVPTANPQHTVEELASKEVQIGNANASLALKEAEVLRVRELLASRAAVIEGNNKSLALKEEEIASAKTSLALKESEMLQMREQLAARAAETEETNKALASTKAELINVQAALAMRDEDIKDKTALLAHLQSVQADVRAAAPTGAVNAAVGAVAAAVAPPLALGEGVVADDAVAQQAGWSMEDDPDVRALNDLIMEGEVNTSGAQDIDFSGLDPDLSFAPPAAATVYSTPMQLDPSQPFDPSNMVFADDGLWVDFFDDQGISRTVYAYPSEFLNPILGFDSVVAPSLPGAPSQVQTGSGGGHPEMPYSLNTDMTDAEQAFVDTNMLDVEPAQGDGPNDTSMADYEPAPAEPAADIQSPNVAHLAPAADFPVAHFESVPAVPVAPAQTEDATPVPSFEGPAGNIAFDITTASAEELELAFSDQAFHDAWWQEVAALDAEGAADAEGEVDTGGEADAEGEVDTDPAPKFELTSEELEEIDDMDRELLAYSSSEETVILGPRKKLVPKSRKGKLRAGIATAAGPSNQNTGLPFAQLNLPNPPQSSELSAQPPPVDESNPLHPAGELSTAQDLPPQIPIPIDPALVDPSLSSFTQADTHVAPVSPRLLPETSSSNAGPSGQSSEAGTTQINTPESTGRKPATKVGGIRQARRGPKGG